MRNDSLSATGVFIRNNNHDLYLVATAHIAKTMDKNVFLIIQGEDRPLQFKITEFANPVTWVYHPTVDLAVLKLNPKPLFFNKYLTDRFIPLSEVDTARLPVPENSLLTIIGFQPGVRSSGLWPPLAYTSIVTNDIPAIDSADLQTLKSFIVLEKPSVSGHNGGPVFLSMETQGDDTAPMVDKKISMVGFIRGRLRDKADRSFTAMIPAFYLRDLIR